MEFVEVAIPYRTLDYSVRRRALSLHWPWPAMFLRGEKTIETRRRPLSWRGPILLHCAKKLPSGVEPMWDELHHGDYAGCVFAQADLVACRRMIAADADAARCNFNSSSFSLIMERVAAVNPLAVRGQQGVFFVQSGARSDTDGSPL